MAQKFCPHLVWALVRIALCINTPKIIKLQLLQMWIFAYHSTYCTKRYKALKNEKQLRIAHSQTQYWNTFQQRDALLSSDKVLQNEWWGIIAQGGNVASFGLESCGLSPCCDSVCAYFVGCSLPIYCLVFSNISRRPAAPSGGFVVFLRSFMQICFVITLKHKTIASHTKFLTLPSRIKAQFDAKSITHYRGFVK